MKTCTYILYSSSVPAIDIRRFVQVKVKKWNSKDSSSFSFQDDTPHVSQTLCF